MRRWPFLLLALLALVQLGPLAGAANAQTPATNEAAEPTAVTQADLNELLRLLSDPRVVEELRDRLKLGDSDGEGDGASLRAEISAAAVQVETRISALTTAFGSIREIPSAIAEAINSGLDQGDALRALTYVLIFLFIGGGFEWLYRQYARPLQLRIAHGEPETVAQRFSRAAGGMALHFAGLAIFAAGSAGAFLLFEWPALMREMVINLLIAVILFRLIGAMIVFILAPGAPDLRLVPLGNRRVRRAVRYIMWAALAGVSGLMAADGLERLGRLTGYDEELFSARIIVPVAAASLLALILIAMVWRLRQPMADDPPEVKDAAPNRQFPIFLTALIVAVFVLWLIGAEPMMWTVLILGMLYPATRTIRAVIGNFYDQAERTAQEAEASEAADEIDAQADEAASLNEDGPPMMNEGGGADIDRSRYGTQRLVVTRFARIILVLLAMACIGWAWGFSPLTLSDSPTLAGRFFRTAVNILVTLLLADLVWSWAKTAIDRRLAEYGPANDGMAPGPEARIATLLPILRMFLMITVAVIVILTVLSAIGINIGPLLAGAGVAGIAIGFGAQALVRDVVSGIFFLLDDAFRVGEYIEMENLRGTVESMSIRSLRVRHHRGAIHTIPFGELKSLTNYSRDWVIMKLEFRVPFDTDLKQVKKIVKQIGAELQAHEGYGHHLIQPLKSQGVRRMEEFNMVIGVKFMARPGAQWLIRRDAYQKLRDAFEKNGISFAQRDVTVKVESDRPLTENEMKAVSGAAQQAAEQQAGPQEPPPDEP